jgi:hypothetical protein
MNWFRQQAEVVTLLPSSLKQVGGSRLSGKKQNLATRALRGHQNRKIDPRNIRHHYIGYEQVRSLQTSFVQSLSGTGERLRRKPVQLQYRHQAGRDNMFVVDYEYAGTWRARHLSPPSIWACGLWQNGNAGIFGGESRRVPLMLFGERYGAICLETEAVCSSLQAGARASIQAWSQRLL